MKGNKILIWILRALPAIILLQTLFFKFTAAPESVFIFSKLNMEPHGRIASGVVELIASLLLLFPRTTWLGALIGLIVITGAIFSHLFFLGIEIMNDGGYLFLLAVIVFLTCASLVWLTRREIPLLRGIVK